MVGNRLFVVIIAACFSFTFSAVVNPKSNDHHKVQSRTWDEAIAMAKAFVAQLTLEEKCSMTEGVGGPCVGNVPSVSRLNFHGLCFQDSPSGVGDGVLHSTAFTAGIHTAATWDRDLFFKRGVAIGKEFQGKGVHFALGPMMNIDRNARHGRNWEGFGSDPYLSGENSFYYVQGVQDQGVVATAKHYICNEQETNRFHEALGSTQGLKAVGSQGYSANLDDKTIHEIYLWPFASSVAAGVGSVMCSYNQVNGTQACQNDKTLNGLLKGELSYPGNVMSDWGATKTGIESVLGGLDVDMPGGDGLMGAALVKAVQSGAVAETRINDMVTRLLAPYYLLEQDQGYPSLDLDRDAIGDNYKTNREVGAAGMVLLKNTNNILPFNVTNDNYYFIYGSAAGQSDQGFGTGGSPQHAGALYQGGGSGFVEPTYGIDPLTSLLIKGRDSHFQMRYITNQNDYDAINNSFRDRGFSNAKCLVFISAFSSEGSDRHDLKPLNDGDKLVQTVASHCTETIVIVNSVSQLNLEAWIDLPNIAAVLWTGVSGSEYGPALVDVLFGDYNPGGKLVFTLAKNDTDFGTDISPTYESNYTEGVFLDYRHFDKYNIVPRYHFGYGLSYTTFSFANLDISKAGKGKHSASAQYRQRRMRPYANIAASKIYEPAYEVTFTVTNTGKVEGSEVPQLYLGFPAEAEEPPKVLRGFEKVHLAAGESKEVSLVLTQKDISYWNVINQKWTVARGNYTVWISTSANNADVKFQTSFNV
jgi:beta-glucosidase-like glycosyl hydrolase